MTISMLNRFIFLIIFLLISDVSLTQVVMRDTTIVWKHYDYTLDRYYSIQTVSKDSIVSDTLSGIVLENELVRVTLVPEFGGRVTSYFYKPTGHEQFYQNEVGVPYLINQNVFYHDWLMIYGGVFPTFPEPEHGKYWNVPWNMKIVSNSNKKVTISMWMKDKSNNPAKPNQYNNGITGITCYFDVTLESGEPGFDIDVRLENDDTDDEYEYWTCTTLAPGSELGKSFTPGNSEIIAPIDQYQVGWNPNGWMQKIDPLLRSSPRVQKYENLKLLSNWQEQGIAYAYPSLKGNHYGVINHSNEVGVFRISDKQEITPGMKFWTWGDKQGLGADVNDFFDYARPNIELWSGVSHEFFTDATFPANTELKWKETYLTTIGLPGISYIDEEIALYHFQTESQVEFWSFLPLSTNSYAVTVFVKDGSNILYEETFSILPSLTSAHKDKMLLDEIESLPETYTVDYQLKKDNQVIYETVSPKTILNKTRPYQDRVQWSSKSAGHLYVKTEASKATKRITLLNLEGAEIRSDYGNSNQFQFYDLESGIYFLKVFYRHQTEVLRVLIK